MSAKPLLARARETDEKKITHSIQGDVNQSALYCSIDSVGGRAVGWILSTALLLPREETSNSSASSNSIRELVPVYDRPLPDMLSIEAFTDVILPWPWAFDVVMVGEGKSEENLGVDKVTEGLEVVPIWEGATITWVGAKSPVPSFSWPPSTVSACIPTDKNRNALSNSLAQPCPSCSLSSEWGIWLGASSMTCSHPTGGEPGGEMRNFFDRAGTVKKSLWRGNWGRSTITSRLTSSAKWVGLVATSKAEAQEMVDVVGRQTLCSNFPASSSWTNNSRYIIYYTFYILYSTAKAYTYFTIFDQSADQDSFPSVDQMATIKIASCVSLSFCDGAI